MGIRRCLGEMSHAVIFVLLFLNGCASSGSLQHAKLNHEFTLRLHEAVLVGAEPVTIRFSALIQDSRCPKEVQCIRAGNATIALELLEAKENRTEIELSTDSGADQTTFGHYKIQLVDVQPYPTAGQQTDSVRYNVTLVVSTK